MMDVNEVKEHISPILVSLTDDELAKRFDYLMFTIELAKMQNNNANRPIRSVVQTAEGLSKLGTIPQVMEQKYIIDKVLTAEFWAEADILELESVREALRELIKFLEKETQKVYYTNFRDEIIEINENTSMYHENDLRSYQKKVSQYLQEHRNQLAVFKLRNNEQLTHQDIQSLEDILWQELGTREDYEKEYGHTPVTKLVRQIVGLDLQAANAAFSEFLTNEQLNVNQVRFVKLIVDYVVKNGIMDKRVLQEEPFKTVGSIVELFQDDMTYAREIIGIIDQINSNAEIFMEA
ncbi:type I restriction modification system%2C R subunit [Streptococcus pneumoniae]|nr:type I restriction modification system%2C R subunit [Streptococcus pneumoniae]CJH67818.1 type I restriction modification system%2C R subunit [Streptococcus pneumoniae]CKD83399.1 type I restriction modification system%2C R subunit [Streptococcus pneumoniae]